MSIPGTAVSLSSSLSLSKVSSRSNVKSSGPSDQWSLVESPENCRYSPASRETLRTGTAFDFEPIVCVLPVGVKGAT